MIRFIGHDLPPHRLFDQGVPGRYNASHAEKQAFVADPSVSSVSVTKNMCSDCQNFFRKAAVQQGRDLSVTDPTMTRTFRPDGTVQSVKK